MYTLYLQEHINKSHKCLWVVAQKMTVKVFSIFFHFTCFHNVVLSESGILLTHLFLEEVSKMTIVKLIIQNSSQGIRSETALTSHGLVPSSKNLLLEPILTKV